VSGRKTADSIDLRFVMKSRVGLRDCVIGYPRPAPHQCFDFVASPCIMNVEFIDAQHIISCCKRDPDVGSNRVAAIDKKNKKNVAGHSQSRLRYATGLIKQTADRLWRFLSGWPLSGQFNSCPVN